MAGDIKDKYAASSTLTVTNLHSLASSQDWTAGWGSAAISNLTDLNLDNMLGGTFTTHASNRQAGQINIYLIAPLNDTPTWPASASGTIGTEGAIAFTDTEERDAACTFLASITVDSTASAVMPFPMRAIAAQFGVNCPRTLSSLLPRIAAPPPRQGWRHLAAPFIARASKSSTRKR